MDEECIHSVIYAYDDFLGEFPGKAVSVEQTCPPFSRLIAPCDLFLCLFLKNSFYSYCDVDNFKNISQIRLKK